MAKCTNCGAEIPDGVRFCTDCGSPQRSAVQDPPAAADEQADRVAEIINSAPVSEPPAETETDAPAQENTSAPEETPAAPAPEQTAAPAPEQPSVPPARPAFPGAGARTSAAVIDRPVQPPRTTATPVYGSYAPNRPSAPVQAPPVPVSDPEKPGRKSKWQIMSSWGTVGAVALMNIPVIGLILTIIWACGGCRKYAKRNLARAVLLLAAIGIVLAIVAALLMRFVFTDELVKAFEYFNPGYTIKFS